MKKLVLLLAVVFSVSMFSCKSNANTEAAPVEEAVVEEVVEVAADTVAAVADSAAAVVDSAAVAE